jgi:hypothetical protein
MGCVVKLQENQRASNRSFYVNLAAALADAVQLEFGYDGNNRARQPQRRRFLDKDNQLRQICRHDPKANALEQRIRGGPTVSGDDGFELEAKFFRSALPA